MSEEEIKQICNNAKKANQQLSVLETGIKNSILETLIKILENNKQEILGENKKDLHIAEQNNLSKAMIQRLELTEKVWTEMIEGIKTVIRLDDPVGRILEKRKLQNEIILEKTSVPLGTIMIIYESRPNVTIDVSVLCIKSGNTVILKGGKESSKTNVALFNCVKESLEKNNLDKNIVQYVQSRELVSELLKCNDSIDVVIPRGGKGLIKKVTETATMPVLKHYEGICNIYIDKYVDKNKNFEKAIKIIENAKVQKPSACNAVENLILHKDIAIEFLPKLKKALDDNKVKILACKESIKNLKDENIEIATKEDYSTEFLDKIISIKIVENLEEALEFISRYGSKHSDAIITENNEIAEKFLKNVDSSAVYHNASTRFTDGGKFGLGCEMGISTDKMHARGPVGLKELTSYKYILRGNGQIRE